MAKQTKGYCKYCGKEYTRGGMLRHLAACGARKAALAEEKGKRTCGYYELVLSGKYNKAYWLIVEIREDALLEDLDRFIRDIWVECCGHLSAFQIGGTEYESHPSGDSLWGWFFPMNTILDRPRNWRLRYRIIAAGGYGSGRKSRSFPEIIPRRFSAPSAANVLQSGSIQKDTMTEIHSGVRSAEKRRKKGKRKTSMRKASSFLCAIRPEWESADMRAVKNIPISFCRIINNHL